MTDPLKEEYTIQEEKEKAPKFAGVVIVTSGPRTDEIHFDEELRRLISRYIDCQDKKKIPLRDTAIDIGSSCFVGALFTLAKLPSKEDAMEIYDILAEGAEKLKQELVQ